MQNNLEYLMIEVAYARSSLPSEQKIIKINLPNRSTIEYAIQQSGILNLFPEINLNHNKVGVFGKIKKLTDIINPYDRIEIYLDLPLDPNTARILRVNKR